MDDCEQLCLWEKYEPQVNDYVIWDKGQYGTDEGWVYFKADEYITIETGIKPKPESELQHSRHEYIHTLLVCPNHSWHQLKYVKSRDHAKPQHYSECEN